MRFALLILAALFLAPAPASAQFQGPWNVFAQPAASVGKAKAYSRRPARGAQCGYYLRHKLGHGDPCLDLAQCWLRKFPRTSAAPGVVIVWTRGGNKGHVAKLIRQTGPCRGIVHDNAGTYERNICRNVLGYVRA